MHFFDIFLPKYLVMSKKSSTFAPAFEIEGICAEKKRLLTLLKKSSVL